MFFIGKARIGDWEIWVTGKNPFERSLNLNEEYYECLFTQHKNGVPYYVNPSKHIFFPYFEMKHPPKTPSKNKPETEAEVMYRIHWDAYSSRQDNPMPLWLIHRSIIEKMLADLLTAAQTDV